MHRLFLLQILGSVCLVSRPFPWFLSPLLVCSHRVTSVTDSVHLWLIALFAAYPLRFRFPVLSSSSCYLMWIFCCHLSAFKRNQQRRILTKTPAQAHCELKHTSVGTNSHAECPVACFIINVERCYSLFLQLNLSGRAKQ